MNVLNTQDLKAEIVVSLKRTKVRPVEGDLGFQVDLIPTMCEHIQQLPCTDKYEIEELLPESVWKELHKAFRILLGEVFSDLVKRGVIQLNSSVKSNNHREYWLMKEV